MKPSCDNCNNMIFVGQRCERFCFTFDRYLEDEDEVCQYYVNNHIDHDPYPDLDEQ